MDKRKYIFGLVGLALGFIVSFFSTQYINKNAPAAAPSSKSMETPGGPQSQQAMMADVRETIEKARNNPKDFDAQIEAAILYAQIGQAAKAVPYLEKAYEINPRKSSESGIPPYIGQYYLDQKNYTQAEAWYRRGLDGTKDKAPVYVELASTFLFRNPPDPNQAIQYIQSALKIDPKDTHALSHLIDAHLLKKDSRAAEEALNRLKETEPNSKKIQTYQNLIADLKSGKPVTIPKE